MPISATDRPRELRIRSQRHDSDEVRVAVQDSRIGLDLQRELAGAQITMPIIFTTGHGDIPMTVQAMKAGAVEFLTKLFRDPDLLDAIAPAIA
jgi:FixJ family two-component response regulator